MPDSGVTQPATACPQANEQPAPSCPPAEPWPLPTRAPYRILAWPRYDTAFELEAITALVGAMSGRRQHLCLCLRFDPERDGDIRKALPLLEQTLAPLNNCGNLELLVVDEPMTPADWPRLGQAVSCAVKLLSSGDGPRAAFMQALSTRGLSTASELQAVIGDRTARRPRSDENQTPSGQRPQHKSRRKETRRHARQAIMQRWLDRAHEDSAPYFPPVRLDICLTNACNIKCAYCWQQEKTKSQLSFDAVADVVDSISAIWPPAITFTGGEPTVWPDFLRLASYCEGLGITRMRLISNGLRLADPDFASECIEAGITTINLSVDTFDPENFERLRGFPFAKFEQALGNCIALKRSHPRLIVALCSVLHNEVTPEELHTVRTFCTMHGLRYFMQTFFDTGYPEINRRFALTPEERDSFKERLDWLEGQVGDVVKRDANPLTETKTSRCYKGATTVKIYDDGGLSCCWSTPVIGNILRESFMDIWTSEKARAVREFIRERRCKCNFDCDIFESLDLPQSTAELRAGG